MSRDLVDALLENAAQKNINGVSVNILENKIVVANFQEGEILGFVKDLKKTWFSLDNSKPLSGAQKKRYRNNKIVSPDSGKITVSKEDGNLIFVIGDYTFVTPEAHYVMPSENINKGEVMVSFQAIQDIIMSYRENTYDVDPNSEYAGSDEELILHTVHSVLREGSTQYAYNWHYKVPVNEMRSGMALKLSPEAALDKLPDLPILAMSKNRYKVKHCGDSVKLSTQYKDAVFPASIVEFDNLDNRAYEAGEQLGKFVQAMDDFEILSENRKALERVSDYYMLSKSKLVDDYWIIPASLGFSSKMEKFEKVLERGEKISDGPIEFKGEYVEFGDIRIYRNPKKGSKK